MPIPQGPLDFFQQFRFLDPHILGHSTFTSYRAHYAVLKSDTDPLVQAIRRRGAKGPINIVDQDAEGRPIYRHLNELTALIASYSFRVRKAQCLDLPDKLYETRKVTLPPEQMKLYKQLVKEAVVMLGEEVSAPSGITEEDALMWYLFDGPKVRADLVITKYIRWQQITGGFVKLDDKQLTSLDFVAGKPTTGNIYFFKKNPKLDALMRILDDATGKVIIWSRFRPEIEMISQKIRETYGRDSIVEYHGGVSPDDRAIARKTFQDLGYNTPRFFVGQPQSGGIGLTLTAATTVVYYSNSFDLEQRMQSEDRAHRIGQKNAVLYIDIVAEDTIDEKVAQRLRQKAALALEILDGENYR